MTTSTVMTSPQVASFAQVEAPAEDIEKADAAADGDADADGGEEGSRQGSDRARPARDSSGNGDQETASTDVDADGKDTSAAAGGDDALLPDGPAMFGERPIDRYTCVVLRQQLWLRLLLPLWRWVLRALCLHSTVVALWPCRPSNHGRGWCCRGAGDDCALQSCSMPATPTPPRPPSARSLPPVGF